MSLHKIQKFAFSKEVQEAIKSEMLQDTNPPGEIYECASSLNEETLLKTTIDGEECRLPFEVLTMDSTPDLPYLDETGITRKPFQCPIGSCQERSTLFMFPMHISYDHKNVLIESLWPSETNKVLVDPYAPESTQPHCHKLYLLNGKIRGRGDDKKCDKLPFALMSSKISCIGSDRFILWVTGPDAGKTKRQHYTLEAGRNQPARLLPYAVAFSEGIVPLHSSQDAEEIQQMGVGLVIPWSQLDALTDKRTKLLEVCVHFH
ncbi:uncharacterized protein LOC128725005 [Anopheles nili]|uniref:uncharacterized protein LOC128725005 n=1 Tax=Anopheles nili TaxID=185578 RepID=UPI00237A27D8|nr:uncharacterized protein LOC128725005 [Anopheles nili]